MSDAQEKWAPVFQHDAEAYPLTGLQHAYWVGEQQVYKFHTVPFLYFCYFTETLDVARL